MQITREIDPVGGGRDEQTHQSDGVKIYLDGVNFSWPGKFTPSKFQEIYMQITREIDPVGGGERWTDSPERQSKNLPRRGKFLLTR